jgi:chemotaxis protein methyltransferase CheR
LPRKKPTPKTTSKRHLYMLEEQLGARFGWSTDETSRNTIISCVNRKAEKLGLDEITYYNTLLKSPAELMSLAEQTANSDTRFFREPKQFNCIREEVLPELAKTNKAARQLRIWSAGCSTGEEAYSIAMLCREKLRRLDEWQIEILGTDLSSKALLDANQGKYSATSLRNVSEEQRQKFFAPVGETTGLQLKLEIKKMVSFRRGNLVEQSFWRQIKKGYDLIICSHMLVHLHSVASKQVIRRITDALRPGGYLMVAEQEKGLIDGPGFTCMNGTAVFYKKDVSAEK